MTAPTLTTVAVLDSSGSAKSMDVLQDGANSSALASGHFLVDGKLNAGARATINAGSLAATATDPSLVVEISPNNGAKILDGAAGVQVATVVAASTPAALTDPSLVVALNPSSKVKLLDTGGTNVATIKAASTATTALDTALVVAPRENLRTQYSTGANLFTLPATPSDVIEIGGSATKTVRIRKIVLSGNATTVAQWPVKLIRRAAAIADGTPVSPGITKWDTGDAAVSGVIRHFTALGTPAAANPASSVMLAQDLTLTAPASAVQSLTFDFTDKPIVLRGAADCLVVNLGGGALVAGEKLSYSVTISEEASA